MSRIVESEAAEVACGDVQLLQAEYGRSLVRAAFAPSGRLPGPVDESALRTAQLTIASTVAIAEHYSVNQLRDRNVAEQDLSTWPKQEASWNSKGVKLSDVPTYSKVRGFNEARNATMHGRGWLTPRQLDPKFVGQVTAWLADAQVKVANGRIMVDKADVDHCAAVCRDFIIGLDAMAASIP